MSRPTTRHIWLAAILLVISIPIGIPSSVRAGDSGQGGGDLVLPPLVPQANSIYYIPQLGNGSTLNVSITSRISLTSLRATDGVATVSFYKDDGSPWTVPVGCSQDNSLSGQFATLPLVVQAGKSLTFETSGYGPLAIGWAKVEADFPLLVTASYTVFTVEAVPAVVGGALGRNISFELGPPPLARERPLWAAGVPSAACGTMLSFNPVIGPDTVMQGVTNDAGIAIANPSSNSTIVTVRLISQTGTEIGTKLVNLPPLGHYAGYVTEIFSGVSFPQHSQVTVRLSSNVNITAVALQRNIGNGADINASLNVMPDSSLSRTVLYDTENNGDRAHAQVIIPTCEVIGTQVNSAGGSDADYYSVYLNANQTIYITLLTESIGSPIDPGLFLQNSSGGQVAAAVDLFAGMRDATLTYKTTVNGTYYIRLGTVNGTSGQGSFYRMLVRVK